MKKRAGKGSLVGTDALICSIATFLVAFILDITTNALPIPGNTWFNLLLIVYGLYALATFLFAIFMASGEEDVKRWANFGGGVFFGIWLTVLVTNFAGFLGRLLARLVGMVL